MQDQPHPGEIVGYVLGHGPQKGRAVAARVEGPAPGPSIPERVLAAAARDEQPAKDQVERARARAASTFRLAVWTEREEDGLADHVTTSQQTAALCHGAVAAYRFVRLPAALRSPPAGITDRAWGRVLRGLLRSAVDLELVALAGAGGYDAARGECSLLGAIGWRLGHLLADEARPLNLEEFAGLLPLPPGLTAPELRPLADQVDAAAGEAAQLVRAALALPAS